MLDGEQSPAEQATIDEHLAGCAACRQFVDQTARVNRLARIAVATEEPDITEAVLAAAPPTTTASPDHSSASVPRLGRPRPG